MAVIEPTNTLEQILVPFKRATGWRGDFAKRLKKDGLPTKRDEDWKWSDVTRASKGILGKGKVQFRSSVPPEWTEVRRAADQDFFSNLLAYAAVQAVPFFEPKNLTVLDLDFRALRGVSHAAATIVAGAGVKFRVHEHYSCEEQAFSAMGVDYVVGPGSRVERVILIDEAPKSVLLLSSGVTLHETGEFVQTVVSQGGKLVRHETQLHSAGGGARATLNAAYLVGKGAQADIVTRVNLHGPGGELSQLIKGIAYGGGRGVFQGKIHVDQAAQKTDAKMTHRGMIVDEKSEINAKPELEIYADDVECAHGNAIGTLDEMALFYMQQRGLPEADARRLLVESFLDEALAEVTHDRTAETIRGVVSKRLKGLL
ncbi:MAG: Fe-S cluster assembly protein SufD [Hyphobacterium sp.]|nr:MAG: Fe-S cluster assembly protein SufD [Hyphobacterium sp.]